MAARHKSMQVRRLSCRFACMMSWLEEHEMKRSIVIGVALAAAVALPAFAVESGGEAAPVYHHHVHHHVHHHLHNVVPAAATAPGVTAPVATTQVPAAAPAPFAFPSIKPYPDGKGDEDGLSESVDDCNKGCIDGNPN